MMKTTLLALAAALFAQTAQADPLKPMAAKVVVLGETTGVLYYTREPSGFRVVATMSTEGAKPIRFVANLADGQAVIVSIPAESGQLRQLEIRRRQDTLAVDDSRPLTAQAWFD